MADDSALEQRTVEVNDPTLSPEANAAMTDAVREIIGEDAVWVPADRIRASQGERGVRNPFERISAARAMATGAIAVGAGVGMVIAMTDHRWWTTGVAFLVLVVTVTYVMLTIMGLASNSAYADPMTIAKLDEMGITDIEPRLSEIVREFTPPNDDYEDRSTAVEDDPGAAAGEQGDAMTPSGGASKAVGPGD